jgi:hypothetical protein
VLVVFQLLAVRIRQPGEAAMLIRIVKFCRST